MRSFVTVSNEVTQEVNLQVQNLKYVPQAVSAIIPTYNRARYLTGAIDSVLQQTVRPMELIVVDDGSSDSTSEILKVYGENIRVICKENGGKSSALNLGLKSARGEFIWIFDDDDVALPNCLEKLVGGLADHPECGFSYGSYDHLVDERDGKFRIIEPDLRIDRSIDFRISVLERCFIFQPGMLVRRSVFDEVGPFNESLVRSQDYEMLLRITRQFSGIEINSIVFHQRQHPGLRGSANAPVARGQIQSSWIKYDDLIFSEVYRGYPLSEYLRGRYSGDLGTRDTRCALLERSCIMARKGMWAHAAADLKAYAALVQAGTPIAVTKAEQLILRRFFGPFSYADSTLAESTEFFNVLRNLSSRRLRWMIGAELFTPIAMELGHGIRRGYIRYVLGTARKCLVFITKYLGVRGRRERAIGVISGMESR
jgi:glycosyltransferase involved in cell wall biosynthesis